MQKSWEGATQHLLSGYERPLGGPQATLRASVRLRQLMQELLQQVCSLCNGSSAARTSPFTRLLLLVLLAVACCTEVSARPTTSSGSADSNAAARWDFTCKQDSTNAALLSNADEEALFRRIVQESERANAHSNSAVQKFLDRVFEDKAFPESVKHLRQEWLPQLQMSASNVNADEALRMSFTVLQHYAVAFEQMIFDELFGDEALLQLFRQTETYLYQLLNRVQLSVCMRKLDLKKIERNVMHDKYKQLANNSKRFLRNYLILRDYNEATGHIKQLFSSLL